MTNGHVPTRVAREASDHLVQTDGRTVEAVARRVVDALPTASGTVLVRDRCGRAPLVDAVVAECRSRGLDPVVEHVSNERLREILGSSSPAALEQWDVDRTDLTRSVNGLIVLGGWSADLAGLPQGSVSAWVSAVGRVERVLEQRRVPTVVVAVPTDHVARRLGMALPELEARVLPALLVSADSLNEGATSLLRSLRATSEIEVRTGAGTLIVERGHRPLMVDDGVVDDADVALGAVVSNLPAGSSYWTVIEDATRGDIGLTDGSVLRFDGDGRVVDGPYAGERISHLGIATNAQVRGTIGWTIVDEHRRGAVFLALGENRYLGGENESTVNVDLLPASPTVVADGAILVDRGVLVSR